ncbi:unnamed protein product [Rhodiola kirilowii]
MSSTGGRSGNVADGPRRRGRPRLRKKSIAELEREMEMKSDRTKPADGVGDGMQRNNGGERGDDEMDFEERRGENSERVVGDGEEREESGEREEEEPVSEDDEDEEEEEEDVEDRPKPIGSSIGSADKGCELYFAFESDGKVYELEDAVMLAPEDGELRPGVAIIKEIRQAVNGKISVILRWLYRPEEVNIKDDPRWLLYNTRELLLTDHKEEVPVATILYKCVVHFLPSHKQLPNRRVHPGFVVQHFYDHLKQRVFGITDEGYCIGSLRKEICVRRRETELRIGYVPNIAYRDNAAYLKRYKNNEPLPGKNAPTPNDGEANLSHDKQCLERSDEQPSTRQQNIKTPRPRVKNYYVNTLNLFGVLTRNDRRNRSLEKLLEGIHSHWDFISSQHDDGLSSDPSSKVINETAKSQKHIRLVWPDSAIPPIFSLEDETDLAYGKDTQRYHQKMRQLVFNLKSNRLLAKRFVTQELKPSILLNMTPDELKAGLTAEELPRNDSDGKQEIQMVNVHCKRCSEKKVRLLDVIQAGIKQRYQLECTECGNTWFASSNEIVIAD